MAEILTTEFRSDTTRYFVDDVLSNDYYLFVSRLQQVDSENSITSKNDFLSKTLFGKKIAKSDIKFMIKYYPWQRGAVYTQYDDNIDLEGKNFYSVVGPNNNTTGDYRVYKCLFNNDNAGVTTAPQYIADTPSQIYQTADGYIWKYMYEISKIEFDAYNALGYIPVMDVVNTNPTANTGSEITNIFVENEASNQGYKQAFAGTLTRRQYFSSLGIGSVDVVFKNDDFSQVLGYYVRQTIYFTNSDRSSRDFEITYYQHLGGNSARIQFKTDSDWRYNASTNPSGVQNNASVKIFPSIEINGDGSGARAVPNINEDETSIKSITMVNNGSNYNTVTARIIPPIYDFNPDDPDSTDEEAILRPVLSPVDGHGTNLIDELKCKHFLFYAYITATDNNNLGIDNTYSTIGVVKNPSFYPPSETVVFTLTIAAGTNSYGAGNKYYIDSVLSPVLELTEGRTYRFDQSDASNTTHQLRFSTTGNGTWHSGVEYTTGVSYWLEGVSVDSSTYLSGFDAATSRYIEITVAENVPTLHYYCVNHSGMGSQANTVPYRPELFDNRITIITDDIDDVTKNDTIIQLTPQQDITFSSIVHQVDESSNTAYLCEFVGPYPDHPNTAIITTNISLNPDLDFRNSTGQIIKINTPIDDNLIQPIYKQRTGRIYFMEDFFPLTRTENSREEYKLVMEF